MLINESKKGGIKKRNQKKGGEEFHIFIKTEFIFEKKTQTGTGVVSKVIARLLERVGDAIGV